MRAGKLRHLVKIQKRTLTSANGYEPHTPDWETHATVWGNIRPLSGRESSRDSSSGQEQAEVRFEGQFRHVSGVTADMRVLWGDRVFDIQAARNIDERDRETVLDLVERL